MGPEKAATSAALRQVLDLLSGGRGARGLSKAQRKAEVVRESLKTLTRNPKDLDKLVKTVLQISKDFMSATRGKKQALQIVTLAEERALCVSATRANAQPPPVLTNRTDRRVHAAKKAATDKANKLAEEARSGKALTKKELDTYLDAFDELYNLGVPREVTAKLGYFLGYRQIGASATAGEIALAKEGLAARDMLMKQFHKAAMGKEDAFLKNVSQRVREALKSTTDKKAMLSKAKEILRDEFALMRTGALDAVLADAKMTRQLEDIGFKVKKWDEVKHLKNAKYLPRLFFEANVGGNTVQIGFDIDHSLVGFAESRTAFVEDLLASGAKVDEQLLRPIFDAKNFTLETARHNRQYLERVRAEGERFDAAMEAAKESLPLGKGKSTGPSALSQAAAQGLQNLEEMNQAAARVKLMMARLSTMEDSPAKRELMDSLAELSSILGDSL